MKNISVLLVCVVMLFRCSDDDITPKSNSPKPPTVDVPSVPSVSNNFFVSTTGSDANDGSINKPWRTLLYAITKVPANQGYTIKLSAGTFVESDPIEVPLGVSILGEGKTKTILKATSTLFYHPATPDYALDKFLIRLSSSSQSNGNQHLSNFSIDGDSKQLHGGIYVNHRDHVTIENVSIQSTNFTGIWLLDVKDSEVIDTELVDCAWGNSSYCSGALNLGNIERVDISTLDVNESKGYGIKAIGPNGNNNIHQLKLQDSHISVAPNGLWDNGKAPNIAIELWQVNLVGCEISNSYVDNTISLVNSNATPSTGIQTIRVHHNTIDLETRSKGTGYGIELTIHDAEIDHNYFIKGAQGIANWSHPMKNWSIHHNTFYALSGTYPGEIVRSQSSGLHNVSLFNNTVEFEGDKTMNVVGLYGGSSENLNIKNNLFINNNTSYSYYPNSLIHLENGAALHSLAVKNNSFTNLPIGGVPGTYSNNLTTDPLINKSGSRPGWYYKPKSESPLVDAGTNVGFDYLGAAPDVGAIELK